MRRLMRAPALLLAAAATTLLVAGCGTENVNVGNLEKDLSKQLTDKGEKPRAVECPDKQKAEKGTTFTCTTTDSSGNAVNVKVTLTSAEHYKASIQ
jgi:hypothetical protein